MSRICLGYGDTERKCTNPAGCPHSPYWCVECNAKRMAALTASLEEIGRRLEARGGEPRKEG